MGWVLEIESFFVQSGGQDQIWAEQKPKIVTLQWMAKRYSVARDARAGFVAGTLRAYILVHRREDFFSKNSRARANPGEDYFRFSGRANNNFQGDIRWHVYSKTRNKKALRSLNL